MSVFHVRTLAPLRATETVHLLVFLSSRIVEKEFTLSGSEQNPDLTGKDVGRLVRSRLGKGASGPVQAFLDNGADFVVRDDLGALIEGMQDLPGGDALDPVRVRFRDRGARPGDGQRLHEGCADHDTELGPPVPGQEEQTYEPPSLNPILHSVIRV